MRRIFISGAHGIGKSTLAKLLSDKLGWELKTEAARSVIEKMGNPKDMDFSGRLAFQEAVYKAQRKNQGRGYLDYDEDDRGGMVIDRSLLDVSAYLELFYDQAANPVERSHDFTGVAPGEFRDYASLRLRILSDFFLSDFFLSDGDLLVILPLRGEKPVDDGVRFLDGQEEFQELLMKDYWKMSDLHPDMHKRTLIIEEPGTPEEYVQKVLDFLLYK